MKHIRYECKHGLVMGQCRCPAPNKTVEIIECSSACTKKDQK